MPLFKVMLHSSLNLVKMLTQMSEGKIGGLKHIQGEFINFCLEEFWFICFYFFLYQFIAVYIFIIIMYFPLQVSIRRKGNEMNNTLSILKLFRNIFLWIQCLRNFHSWRSTWRTLLKFHLPYSKNWPGKCQTFQVF